MMESNNRRMALLQRRAGRAGPLRAARARPRSRAAGALLARRPGLLSRCGPACAGRQRVGVVGDVDELPLIVAIASIQLTDRSRLALAAHSSDQLVGRSLIGTRLSGPAERLPWCARRHASTLPARSLRAALGATLCPGTLAADARLASEAGGTARTRGRVTHARAPVAHPGDTGRIAARSKQRNRLQLEVSARDRILVLLAEELLLDEDIEVR